jgi:DNA-binding CsgD family transcriptional regulator
MHGRDAEIRHVSGVVARGGVLVVRGEAGTGKSMLLDHAAAVSGGAWLLRGAGGQVTLPFAALHQVPAPVLGFVDRLPDTQAASLRSAVGLGSGAADPLRVALGAVGVPAEAAAERPVVCLVDDAHRLDRASAEVLSFVAARLPDRVALVIATRDAGGFTGLPESVSDGLVSGGLVLSGLVLSGLDPAAAAALLDARHPGLAGHVRERVVRETGGNPAALLAVPVALTGGQRRGDEPLPGVLPLPASVRQAHLPASTDDVLLLVAAEEEGDLDAVLRAAGADHSGALSRLEAAENAGVLVVGMTADGPRVRFRHPPQRLAVYHDAPFTRRAAAHRALAAVLTDPYRRARHLTAAGAGPDDVVAADLARVAVGAAPGIASRTLEQAAWLTGSPVERAGRLRAAGEAAHAASRHDRARSLADQAERTHPDPVVRAESRLLRAEVEFDAGSMRAAAPELLVESVTPIAADHPGLAATMLVQAVKAGWFGNDVAGLRRAVEGLERLDLPPDSGMASLVRTVSGLSRLVHGEVDDAVAYLRAGSRPRHPSAADHASTSVHATTALMLGDDRLAVETARALVAGCRTDELRGRLPATLALLATQQMTAGEYRGARATATEGLALAVELGQVNHESLLLAVLAWLDAVAGRVESCLELSARALRLAEANGVVVSTAVARWALGLLWLGDGQPDRALEQFTPLGSHPIVRLKQTADLVEAAWRAGRVEVAEPDLARFEVWAEGTGLITARALAARSRALVTGDEEAFLAALRLHDRADPTYPRLFDRARTGLLYGEWLRRARRRADARVRLRAAEEGFAQVGATGWAERARHELRATGAGGATAADLVGLTPQELRVVRLAGTGLANREIGARLFLSPRTVSYHLYKAFPKLGVRSRGELARLLAGEPG